MNSLLSTSRLLNQRLAVHPLLNLNTVNLIALKSYLSKTKKMPPVHQLSFIIDGPAASGKTEISKGVSKKLGFNWVDSQAIYRALILKCKNNNIEVLPSNGKKIGELASNTDFDFLFERDDDSYKVLMDNEDVTNKIKSCNISDKDVLSALSIPEITEAMKNKQRRLVYISEERMRKELEKENDQGNSDKSKLYCTILEGRAAGKNVFPDAHLIFNLKADIDIRADRRFKELDGKQTKEAIIEEMKENETNFKELTTPIKRALTINTTELTKDEQVETIGFLIKDRIKRYFDNIGPMY
jgi:cytidylate kinase